MATNRQAMQALAEQLHLLWSSGDLSMVTKLYMPDFVAHLSDGWEFRGHDGVRRAVETCRGAFPDWTETIQDLIVEGDRFVTRYVSTGEHLGPLLGLAPTGEQVRLDEISVFRVKDGRVAEQWCLTELASWFARRGGFAASG